MNDDVHADLSKSATGRSLFSRGRLRREAGLLGTTDDPKGPLGLCTLSEPEGPPIADLVFVHGLGGGSRSTWTKELDLNLFWPKEWLPQDTAFRDVRIHSFGYDSDLDHESVLNIHDFAKSLLGSIHDCPRIPKSSTIPLVFVGHSMGGLLIKRAYVLAKQHQEFAFLAQRVRAIYFLATPHRGSDLATVLKKILHVMSGARPFISDLQRNSLATQSINDEFPQHCQQLQLFSFYETLPMSFGLGKSLIVDKDLAVLGYPNERSAYVNADHRGICKFSTPMDPNYLTVRNALAATFEGLREEGEPSRNIRTIQSGALLDDFLGVSDAPDDDLMRVEARCTRGSCQWLTKRESFQMWCDSPDSHLYWIAAKPATGKSILSGFIVRHLKEKRRDCSFYFFNYSDKTRSTISHFLRSIAWQMAILQPQVYQAVLELSKKNESLSKADYRSIWRKLFLTGIFTVPFRRPQYWVIDGIDECRNGPELIPLLFKAAELCQVRIIVTSRDKLDLYGLISRSRTKVISDDISEDDTQDDISLYLQSNIESLPALDSETQQTIMKLILLKSAGCFLWVDLVLQELRRVHTSREILMILEQIPSGMDDLYSRILDQMAIAPYGKVLTKAILTWVVCSARPLTTEELHYALESDIKDKIDRIETSILACCGQLVYLDSHARVHMIHKTAKDFLLRDGLDSDFAIDKREGHLRLAMTSIEYLGSREMTAPRQRKLSASSLPRLRSAFVAYACRSLFEHIAHISPKDDDKFLPALANLLSSSNILAWIEYLAENSELRCIIQTGKAIKKYLQRRSKYVSPFGKDVAILDDWATDFVRLAGKFGANLLASPSSIFYLIPPFCPLDSAPRKQFGTSARGIAVLGLSNPSWDESLTTIIHPHEQMTAIACSVRLFAVGTATGKVAVYQDMTCQEAQILQQPGPVRILQFSQAGNVIASGGIKKLRVWDVVSWQQTWTFDIAQECMSIQFTDEDKVLVAALKNNFFMAWDLTTGEVLDSANWTDDLKAKSSHAFHHPITAALCVDSSLLAIVYRGHEIILWDIDEHALYETYNKETGALPCSNDVSNMVTGGITFSQDPSVGLLAASYSDGSLVVFETQQGTVKAQTLAYAQTLASSADGLTLATADSEGTIKLFEFESLRLLYRIKSEEYGVKALAFSISSHRLLDIGGSECRVWEPAVLLREDVEEEMSDTISMSTAPQEVNLESAVEVVLITSLALHEGGDVFFCGKDDGSVHLYATSSGTQIQRMFSHASGASVVLLQFDQETQILTSTDSSSRVMSHKLTREQDVWRAIKADVDLRAGTAVVETLSNKGRTRILVSSVEQTVLYSLSKDVTTALATIRWDKRRSTRWITHPVDPNTLILISDNIVHLYDWLTMRRLTGDAGISLDCAASPLTAIHVVHSCSYGSLMATSFVNSMQPNSKSRLLFWDASHFSDSSASANPVPGYECFVENVHVVIGTYEHRLVYLHSTGWICSIDLEADGERHPTRHFFIPMDWLGAGVQFMTEVSCRGEILFVRKHEVAVIQRGLEISELTAPSTKDRPAFVTSRRRKPGQSPLKARSSEAVPLSLSSRPKISPLGLSENPLSPQTPRSRSMGSSNVTVFTKPASEW